MPNDRPAVVWFRRDLRLHDHPALTAASADGRSSCHCSSSTRGWWAAGSPARTGRGSCSRPFGRWPRAWRRPARRSSSASATHERSSRRSPPRPARPMSSSRATTRRTGAHGIARCRRDWRRPGSRFHAKRGTLVHEPEEVATADGRPFTRLLAVPPRVAGATAPRDRASAHGPARAWRRRPGSSRRSMPSAWGRRPRPTRRSLPTPGERAARARLDRWLATGVDGYAATRDRLDLVDGTSRLSADLHLGLAVGARGRRPGGRRRGGSAGLRRRAGLARVLRARPVPSARGPPARVPAGVRRRRVVGGCDRHRGVAERPDGVPARRCRDAPARSRPAGCTTGRGWSSRRS